MPTSWMLPLVAAAFGLAAGWACNRLFAVRWAEAASEAFHHAYSDYTPPVFAGAVNLVVLCGGSFALALHPSLGTPLALSQALLLFYLAYPLAVVDLVTLTVEPALVLGGLALRMGVLGWADRAALPDMLGGALGGAGLLYLIGFAYRELRGREGLGSGDPGVLALIGGFVGWQGLPGVIVLGTASALLIGFPALLILRRPLDTPLPFVPFLCAGGCAVYLMRLHGIVIAGYIP